MPRVITAALCNDIQDNGDGKNTLIDVLNQFEVSDITMPLPPFSIFIRVLFDQEETKSPMTLEFRADGGKTLFLLGGEHYANFSPNQMGMKIDSVRVPKYGTYEVVFCLKGKPFHSHPLDIVRAPDATVH